MHPLKPNGFILLEVLIAMSLILGSWMASVGVYQGLVLRLTQDETKRTVLRQTFDAYEISGVYSNRDPLLQKGAKNESSRVSSRNSTMHPPAQSITQNRR